MDKILILDFGSQTTALIGRRIREAGVYAEIVAGDSPLDGAGSGGSPLDGARGIILSGSPESVYASGIAPDKRVYECGLPLLGICYGLQRMTADLGGLVSALPKWEYGGVEVRIRYPEAVPSHVKPFLEAFGGVESFTAWMSHGDTLTKLAPGFIECGTSASGFPAVLAHEFNSWFGLQFHPELTHTRFGSEILSAFVFGICGCAKSWTMEAYLDEAVDKIRRRVGDNPVLLLISGGVDSAVAGALLLRALDADSVHFMYMDTGLMRKNETSLVKRSLEQLGARHLHIVHCEDEFFTALSGISAPEDKRKIIGDLFITIQERELARLGLSASYFLAQGTLYTDLIESGKGVGNSAHLIKSHHNVGSPLVAAKRQAGRLIEPLDALYKDEARALGRLLGLDELIVGRHPFPGPGLAVRIPGEVTREKCEILREADAVFINELRKRRTADGSKSLYDDIWQAFVVLLPVRSVGVAGDARKYGWVAALRAVTSADGMSAGVYPFAPKDLIEISTLITNNVESIGRVTYDISSKPPATIEWE
ncbi:MAG: glutamine-hydrolyzing GMP synthase [Spirochaetaceae bacterium]|jgi:GMP synthase (glutamine-hydrolysing)|nr:glutamine-hydrolyzing GMP synthase [Spirochaetaceae bacterium]